MLLATVATYAQQAVGTLTLQPKVALNIASITESDGSDPRIAPAIGAELEYQFTDIFSLSGGVIYSIYKTRKAERDKPALQPAE